VDLLFGSIPAAAPHVAAARVKGIAITGPARSPLLPGVPTATEQGMPNLAVSAWFGVMAPADVPSEVLRQLDDAFRIAALSEGLRASLSKLGLNVIGADRNAFAARIRQETQQWAEIIRVSGAKAE
jgi:tripartite-type tricarboxylate transporter receptor subunit TctC